MIPGTSESMTSFQGTISRCNFYLIIATVPATEVNSTDSVTTNETITISIIDAFLSKIGPAKGCNPHLIAKEESK